MGPALSQPHLLHTYMYMLLYGYKATALCVQGGKDLNEMRATYYTPMCAENKQFYRNEIDASKKDELAMCIVN